MKIRSLAAAAVLAAAAAPTLALDLPYFRFQGFQAGAGGPTAAPDGNPTNDPAAMSLAYTGTEASAGYPITASPTVKGNGTNLRYRLTKGTLPGTISLDEATGFITGTVAQPVDIPVTITVEDLDAKTTGATSFVLRLSPVDTVALAVPRVSQGGTDVTGAAYDTLASTLTGSASQTLMTFDRYRTADGFEISGPGAAGPWTLEGQTVDGWVTAATGSGAASAAFPSALTAQSYRLTAGGALAGMRVLYGGTAPYALSIDAPPRLVPTLGQSISQALYASNASGPTGWSVLSGVLPPNMTLGTDGTIGGAPSGVGVYKAEIVATDSRARSAPASLTVAVQAAATAASRFPITVSLGQVATFHDAQAASSALFPAGSTFSIAYDAPVRANGVVADIDYGSSRLELDYLDPASNTWWNASSATSATSGFGAFPDVSAASWRVRAIGSAATVRAFKVAFNGAAPVAPSVAAATYYPEVGIEFTQPLQASDASGPATWRLVSGTLPSKVSLLPGGSFAGTPDTTGTSTIMVEAVDGRAVPSVPATITLVTQSAKTAADLFPVTANGSAASVAALYDSVDDTTSAVSGVATVAFDFGRPLSADGWSASADSSNYKVQALVSGNWADMTQGTPATAQQFRLVSGSGALSVTRFRMTKGNNAPIAPNMVAAPTSYMTQGAQSSPLALAPLTQNSVTSGRSWSLVSGTLPDGVGITPSFTIGGTPTKTGIYTFALSVTDSRGITSVPRSYVISVLSADSAGTIFPSTIGGSASAVGALYDEQASTTYQMNYGSLTEYVYPREVTVSSVLTDYFSSSSIKIQAMVDGNWFEMGSAASNGTNSLTPASSSRFRIQNLYNSTAASVMRLGNNGAPIAPSVVPNQTTSVNAGALIATFVPATVNTFGTKTFTTNKSLLPPGLDIDTSGLVSGTPTTTGTYSFPLQVSDTRGVVSAPQPYTIKVLSPYLASGELPVTINGSADIRTGLYDASQKTAYTIGYYQNIDVVFAREVTADSIYVDNSFYGTGAKIQYRDASGAFVDVGLLSKNGWNTFPAMSSTTFRLANEYGAVSFPTFKVGSGQSAPTTPAVGTTTNTYTASMTQGVAGTAFTLNGTDIGGSYTYALGGTLPTGIGQPTSSGVVSGTPTQPGTFNLTATVKNNATGITSAPLALTLTVIAPPSSSVARPTSMTLVSALDNKQVPSNDSAGYISALYDKSTSTYLSWYNRTGDTLLRINWSTPQSTLDCVVVNQNFSDTVLRAYRKYGSSSDSMATYAQGGEIILSWDTKKNVDSIDLITSGGTANRYMTLQEFRAGNLVNGTCITP